MYFCMNTILELLQALIKSFSHKFSSMLKRAFKVWHHNEYCICYSRMGRKHRLSVHRKNEEERSKHRSKRRSKQVEKMVSGTAEQKTSPLQIFLPLSAYMYTVVDFLAPFPQFRSCVQGLLLHHCFGMDLKTIIIYHTSHCIQK